MKQTIIPPSPMPTAGTYPGLKPDLSEEFSNDMIIPASGGMLSDSMGYTGGAMAWWQAFDAAMKSIKLSEYAKDRKEPKADIEKWGIRKRPRYTGDTQAKSSTRNM